MGNNNKKTNGYPDQSMMSDLIELSNLNTARTFEFNAQEAAKSRDWQEYMSSTSHQREVADLKAAGLNPVLSVNGGAASYSASSASASADNSNVAALANLYMNRINNNTSMALGKLNAAVGYASAAAVRDAAYANASALLGSAAMSAEAQKYASDNSKIASMYSAKAGITSSLINERSAKYVSDNTATGSWPGLAKWLIKGAENSGAPWKEWENDIKYRD